MGGNAPGADDLDQVWLRRGSRAIDYDTTEYPFARVLEQLVFKARPLEKLHLHWQRHKSRSGSARPIGYGDNLALRRLMQDLPDEAPMMRLYHHFIRTVLAPRFGGRISYSDRPKMRVHLAGTPDVSKWHRDVDVTGRTDQINAFLPFTRCFDGSALWCESDYGRGDYAPLQMEYGRLYLFDGGYLAHGTMPNATDCTRISLDFRFALADGTSAGLWSEILAARTAAGL